MTGMDAWDFIAPLIANKVMETDAGMEAYATLFVASQIMDGRRGEKDSNCEECVYSNMREDVLPCRCCSMAYKSQYESKVKK